MDNNKLDQILETLGEMKIQLTEYNAQLKEHIRRTEAAEKRLDRVEGWHFSLLAAGLICLTGVIFKLLG